MPFFQLMVVFALCSAMSLAASGKRLTSLVSKYVLSPATVWAAGYLNEEVDCSQNRTLAAQYAEHAKQARTAKKKITIKPACPAIVVKPVSSCHSFALSEEIIEATFSEDFLRKTSFRSLITNNVELTPLTLMRYLDISLDTYCNIYNLEWQNPEGPDGRGGRYLPPFSLEEKLAFLKQLLHEHPAAYAEAEAGWLVFFHTDEWRKKYGHGK